MNIMLVSVTERTSEIGLRKALGATPKDLFRQFLVESASLTAVGGLLGVSVGLGTALILPRVSGRIPETARIVVVLPAPFAPIRVTSSPSSTVSEMPCSAAIRP